MERGENKDLFISKIIPKDEETKIDLDYFILQQHLGSGAFGKVFKVKDSRTGEIFAAKISLQALTEITGDALNDLWQEVNIIMKLNHPTVLKFIGYSPINFKRKQKPVIITEFAPNGSLDDFITQDEDDIINEDWNSTRKLIIIYGIASGMSYLHSHDILHRDLKPANILIDEFLLPKIADFGLSTIKQDINPNSKNQIKGTPIYISPEIWSKQEYSKAADVYAFGIILYQILTNKKPFENFHYFEIMAKVSQGYRPEFDKEIPKSYRSLIEVCWAQEPINRPTFDEILRLLKNDEGFITESVNKDEYFNYIDYIDKYQTTFNSHKKIVKFNHSKKKDITSYDVMKKVKIVEGLPQSKFGFFKVRDFMNLEEKCKTLVSEAINDPLKQFIMAKSLIEGLDYFPFNTEVGIKYLKNSIKEGNIDALIYYCRMLIKGKIIPRNLEKAKKIVQTRINDEGGLSSLLMGKIMKKEGRFDEAKNCFLDSIDLENSEALYEYGKMIYKGIGSEPSFDGLDYYEKAISERNLKAIYKYAMLIKNGEIKTDDDKIYFKFIEFSGNLGYPDALLCYAKMIEEGVDVPFNVDNAFHCKQISAFLGSIEGMYEYALHCYRLNYKEVNLAESIKFFKKASDRGHIAAMFKYGLILLDKNEKEGKNLIKYSAFCGDSNAMFNYGSMLLDGIRFPVDIKEGMKYLKKSADCGNVFAMVRYGVSIKNKNKNPEAIEETMKYLKMAADKGDSYGLMLYGSLLLEKNESSNDNNEAIEYIIQSAIKGNIDAISKYATITLDGIGVKSDVNKAIKLYQIAIRGGSLNAMHQYGVLLVQGDKIPKNLVEGIRLIKMAAEKGDTKAMYEYGMMLVDGFNVPINKKEGFRYVKMAADKNYLPAISDYAYMLAYGIGVTANKEIAVRYMKIAINKGSVSAMRIYASMLFKGVGVPINKKEAAKYFQMAIEKGDTGAMNCYAQMLYNGNGIPADIEKAIEYFKMAIDGNCLEAMVQYGYLLVRDEDDSKKEEGIKLIKKASDLGFIDAIRLYADLLINGTIKNEAEAANLFKDASDKGDPESIFKYGMMLYKGMGVQANKEKALFYIKMAAEKGSVEAMNNYGMMLIQSDGTESKKEEGMKYLKMAADKGDFNSMNNYGYFLINENKKDEGLKYVKKAADNGVCEAMLLYAYNTISSDTDCAIEYLIKAANKGHDESLNFLIKLYIEGKIGPPNNEEKMKNMKMAADNGSVEHMFCYGMIILNESQDSKEEAFKYVKMAADHGSAQGMNKCGVFLEKGIGTPVNIEEACRYYLMAIEKGSVEANYFYGMLFLRGEVVPVNLELGVKHVKFAAENGDECAMYHYGKILENGVSGPVDLTNAMKYFKMAAEKGVEKANCALINLIEKINLSE